MLNVTEPEIAGCLWSCNVADWLEAPTVPVMVTSTVLLTANVVTGKVANVAPAGMVTVPGTVASAVFDDFRLMT